MTATAPSFRAPAATSATGPRAGTVSHTTSSSAGTIMPSRYLPSVYAAIVDGNPAVLLNDTLGAGSVGYLRALDPLGSAWPPIGQAQRVDAPGLPYDVVGLYDINGLPAVLYAHAPPLNEVGAHLLLPPNVVRLLRRLGLIQGLAPRAVPLAGALRGSRCV